MTIPFRKLVQLVVEDFKLPLYPRSVLDGAASTMDIFQHTKKPSQTFYLTPDLGIQGVLGHGRKQRIKYRQRIKLLHIDENRDGETLLVDALYDKLLMVPDQKGLDKFIENWVFTLIPREEEWENLEKRSQEIGTLPANLELLWRKIQEMQNFATAWKKGDLEEHHLLWLNRELELVSPMYLAHAGYAIKRFQVSSKSKLTESLEDIVGMRKAKSLEPLIGYRVYGHFALCCLELLYDMEAGLQVFSCKQCGKIRKRKIGSKRVHCTKKESKKCFLNRQAKRQQKSRNKPKIAG